MRRYLVFILLAAGSLVAGGGSTLCFADAASPAGAAAPSAPAARPSQREMHQIQQTNSEEQRPGDAAEDQSTGDDHAKGEERPKKEDQNQSTEQSLEAAAETQSFVVPAPSQRNMRQQLRDARQNQAPAAGNR